MPQSIQDIIALYVKKVEAIYGKHLRQIILFGSYARGDYHEDSDIDIMILLNLSDTEIKNFRHKLSDLTFEFNMDHDLDIKPIAKNEDHFYKWVEAYPFYSSVNKEGVRLYAAA